MEGQSLDAALELHKYDDESKKKILADFNSLLKEKYLTFASQVVGEFASESGLAWLEQCSFEELEAWLDSKMPNYKAAKEYLYDSTVEDMKMFLDLT